MTADGGGETVLKEAHSVTPHTYTRVCIHTHTHPHALFLGLWSSKTVIRWIGGEHTRFYLNYTDLGDSKHTRMHTSQQKVLLPHSKRCWSLAKLKAPWARGLGGGRGCAGTCTECEHAWRTAVGEVEVCSSAAAKLENGAWNSRSRKTSLR